MSEDNTKASGDGYLTNLRPRLERDLKDVVDGDASSEDFIKSILDTIYASYKNGQAAGPRRKKASPKGKPDKASLPR